MGFRAQIASVLGSLLGSAVWSLIIDWETLGFGLMIGAYSGFTAALIITAVQDGGTAFILAILLVVITECFLVIGMKSAEGEPMAWFIQKMWAGSAICGVIAGIKTRARGKLESAQDKRPPK